MDSFLEVLEANSLAPPSSVGTMSSMKTVDAAASGHAQSPPRNTIRRLAFALVDKGYLSNPKGQMILETIARRWPLWVPREVLALAARIAMCDAALAAQKSSGIHSSTDSKLVILLWKSFLDVFDPDVAGDGGDGADKVSAVDATGVDVTDPAYAIQSPDARPSKRGTTTDCGGISGSGDVLMLNSPLCTAHRPVLQTDHARLMVFCFATLSREGKHQLLAKMVALFGKHVSRYQGGRPDASLQVCGQSDIIESKDCQEIRILT